MKKMMALALALLIAGGCLTGCGASEPEDVIEKIDANEVAEGSGFKLPSFGICTKLPELNTTDGKINYDSAESADIDVFDFSYEAYQKYVEACQEKGFVNDYYYDENSYEAKDAEGYVLWLYYDEEEKTMNIDIHLEEEEDAYAIEETFEEEEPATETLTEAVTEAPTEETTEVPEDRNLIDGMRPEFKAAMDSYEDFMDEYVAFMEKYNNNPSDLSLLTDYAQYLQEYAEFVEDFEKWNAEDMNTAESLYYIEVQKRVSEKLLKAAA